MEKVNKETKVHLFVSMPLNLLRTVTRTREGDEVEPTRQQPKHRDACPCTGTNHCESVQKNLCGEASLLPEKHASRPLLSLQHPPSPSLRPGQREDGSNVSSRAAPWRGPCPGPVLSVACGPRQGEVRLGAALLHRPPPELLHGLQQGRPLQL